MPLIGTIIIVLIVICAIVYLAQLIPIPEPFGWVKQAIVILVVAAALIWLITLITGGSWPMGRIP